MRNLKRALSLTLASIMLLGMMVVGSSAAGFPDVDDTKNVEAIEVLQAVAVMVGDKDTGNFRPDAPVSRAEMAVIMSNLLGLTTSYYASTCPFDDVSGSYSWARGPVGAAYASKVVSGRTATTFDPAATVTAVEAAAMIMRGLGYFQNTGDYADGFNVSIVRQANLIGLFKGIGSDATTPMTRNQIAQMALNALKSNVVDFTGTPGIKFDGVEVGYKAEYTPRTSPDEIYSAIGNLSTNINGQDQYYVQLGEELYDGDLELRDNDSDDFERPARTWLYDGKEIGSYAKNELVKKTYTAGVSCKTLYDLLTRANLQDYDFEYYVDGKLSDTHDAAEILTRSSDNFGATGNGVLTEVYVNTTAKEITIVSIHTWLAQATADYSSSRESINLKVYTNTTGTTKTVGVDDVPAIENLKKDEWVLVNMSEKDRTKLEVVAIDDVEIIADTALTRFSKDSDTDPNSDQNEALFNSVTANGTKYDSSSCTYYNEEVLDLYDNKLLTGKTYNVYLDNYGYAIGVDLCVGEDSYVFITGYDLDSSAIASGTAKANAIFTDGTIKSINVNVIDTNKNIKSIDGYDDTAADNQTYFETWKPVGDMNNDQTHAINRWYTYTEDKGEYTLSPATRMFTTEVVKAAADPAMVIKCNSVRIDENPAAYNTATNQSQVPATKHTNADILRAYGNDDSIFILADTDTVSTSGTDKVITGVDGIYTGVQNVEIEVTSTATANTAITGTALHDSIYTLYDKNGYIIASVILGDAKGGNANLVYVKSAATSETKDGDDYYWEFDAVVDGELETLTVKSKFKKTINNLNPGHVQEVRYDGEYVVFVGDVDADDIYVDYQDPIDGESVYDIGHETENNVDCWDDDHSDDNNRTDDYRLTFDGSAGEKADDLHMVGKTLFLTSEDVTAAERDFGLTFEAGAKAVVHQQINGKWKWQEFDSVSAAIDALGDADGDDTNDMLGFNGRLTAALTSKGTAKWIVIHSDTDVVTGNTVVTNNKIEGVDAMDITPATGTALNASTLVGSAFTLPVNAALKNALGMTSNVEDCLFFGFNAPQQQDVTIIIRKVGESKTYSETTAGVTAGNHTSYVDILGKPVYHSANATGSLANPAGVSQSTTKTWPKGDYTWTITGAKDGVLAEGKFTVR